MSIQANDIIEDEFADRLLEIDMYALADFFDPNWREHFITPHMAVDFYREDMNMQEFRVAIEDSQ